MIVPHAAFAEEIPESAAAENQQTEQTEQTGQTEEEAEKPIAGTEDGIFVDINAADGGNGSFEKPYNNIQAAKSAAAGRDKSKKVTVYIREGEYEITSGLKFGHDESGTAENPVTFTAYNGEKVVISGAKKIRSGLIKKLSNEEIAAKIPKNARDCIWEINLSDIGSSKFGVLPGAEVFSSLNAPYAQSNYSELVYDDTMLTMARYPNADYLTVVNTLSNSGSGLQQIKVQQISEDAVSVKRWEGLTNVPVAVQDSSWGYRYTFTRMNAVDSAKNAISVQGNLGAFNPDSRFFVFNIPEELDSPGEYYFDRDNAKVYFYPPDKNVSKDVKVTVCEDPMLTFNSAEYITFKDIAFENTRGDGIKMEKSKGIVIDGCTVNNIGGMGITCNKGHECKVLSSTVSNIGYSGIMFRTDGPQDADITAMNLSGNVIDNNDIFLCGRIAAATYYGIDIVYDIGITVTNNRVHNVPHGGINGHAVDSRVAYNEVYNTNRECIDAGAIYFGSSYVYNRGLILEKNYVHDNNRDPRLNGGAVAGIYFDDKTSGVTVRQNIVQNNFLAMLFGGGDDNTIEDNLSIDNKANISYDCRGMNWSKSGTTQQMSEELRYISWPNPAWKARFPELTKLEQMSQSGDEVAGVPYDNTITGNIILGQGSTGIATAVVENAKVYEEHLNVDKEKFDFADFDNYNLTYTKNAKLYTEDNSDFPVIDFENIGLKQKKELGTTELIAPTDKMEGIEGNSAVFRWKVNNGADKYRVQIGLDSNFYAKVYDEEVIGNVLELDNLKYGRTYYWRVQPVKSSASETGDGSFSEIRSFTTAATEMVNKTALSKALDEIGSAYLKANEGTTPGTYKPGAIEEFDKVVSEANDVLNNSYVKQSKVKAMTAKLEKAKKEFLAKQNLLITNVDDFIDDKENWSGPITIENGEIYLNGALKKGNYAGYSGRKIGQYEILRMKTNSNLSNYQGWGMNADHPDDELWKSSGYTIIGKRNIFEIQRRYWKDDGGIAAEILGTVVNEESIMTSGKWYTIEIGCVKTPFGTRIIMNIEGKPVVDFLDSTGLALEPDGYFAFYEGSSEYNSIAKVNN